MPILNSQVFYGWAGDAKPFTVGEGDEVDKGVKMEDYMGGMRNAEESMGQKILQDNKETIRLNTLISDQGLTELPGTATLAETIAEVNKLRTILTNLTIVN